MEKAYGKHIVAIVVLVLVTILCLYDKVSAEDTLKVFLFIVGAYFGVAVGYAWGYHEGYKKGAALIG